jgi:actin-like protein 6A
MFVSSDNSTVVADIGTETYKIGYSNIEFPYSCESTKNFKNNFTSPVSRSVINNLEDYLQILDTQLPPDTSYLLISENTFESEKMKEKILSHVMENNKASSVLFSKSAILDSFSYGKSTAIVISIGGGSTQISSVIDGYITQRRKIDFGCYDITLKFIDKIEKSNGFPDTYIGDPSMPYYENLKSFKKSEFARNKKEDFYRKWVETLKNFNEESVNDLNMKMQFDNAHKNILEIVEFITEVVDSSPSDKRLQLLNNILISGGGSYIGRIDMIIEKKLLKLYNDEKICVINNPSCFHTYQGGVIMGNIGSFKSLNIGRLDYKEYGTSIFKRKNQSWLGN